MKDCQRRPPILIESARGLKLYDAEGNFYYDTISSWWCNVHGHGHPKIAAAIREQSSCLDHVLSAGFTHKKAIVLAEKLLALAPGNLTRVFYSDNGSTAVETALKMSVQHWHNAGLPKKAKFVSLDLAYHGDTCGAMSVGGRSVFTQAFESLLFDSFKVPTPYCYRCPMGLDRASCQIECAGALEAMLREHYDEIAGVILEPLLMGAAGMIVYPPAYLEKAAELARRYDVHLILDEVATGFGRTGKMFACEHAGVEPDFLCLSKGITGGTLPFAATLATEDVYASFYDDYEKHKTLYHGHTYNANPTGCAAALASLAIFEEERTLEKVQGMMPGFGERLEQLGALPHVGDVRTIGMVGALEIVRDKGSKEPFPVRDRIGMRLFEEGLKRNLILRPMGNVTYLFLPLSTTEVELAEILERFSATIEQTKL
jgi:adenosylmethionine-8-amino-7-oxononanoate aminotransferase